MMTQFFWVLHALDGSDMRRTDPFDSRAEAEAWMGAGWSTLLDEGAEEVSLIDEDGAVYYRMGLREE